jgi:glutathione S-transferase
MLKLYYSESSAAYAPHLLLLDAEVEFEAVRIDFKSKEQLSTDFLRINPKGRVPVLVTPGGILTETPALLLYISQINPDKNLAPTNPFELAQAQALNIYIASTVHVGHAHKHRGDRWSDDPTAKASMKSKVKMNMRIYAKFIEEHYLRGPWALGEYYSMCDPYLSLVNRWLCNDEVNLDDFPKLQEHEALIGKRSSHRAIQAIYS